MTGNDSEPTWGDSYVNPHSAPSPNPKPPDAAGYSIPNQQSMPVVGSGHSTPRATGNPHADYYTQSAQHFGASQPNPMRPQPPMHYPAIPPTTPPARPSYAYNSASTGQASFVTRLMERGVRGELFRQPWFQRIRGQSPDPFLFATYAGGFVVTILLGLIPSTFFSTVLTDVLWLAIGYLYFALGTRLSHQFLAFGICLVGALVMLGRTWSTVSALTITRGLARMFGAYTDPTPLLAVVLLLDVAAAAFLIYVGLQVHKGIQRLSQP
jgi:hypothetical protein